jgi:hypothetical protein
MTSLIFPFVLSRCLEFCIVLDLPHFKRYNFQTHYIYILGGEDIYIYMRKEKKNQVGLYIGQGSEINPSGI